MIKICEFYFELFGYTFAIRIMLPALRQAIKKHKIGFETERKETNNE